VSELAAVLQTGLPERMLLLLLCLVVPTAALARQRWPRGVATLLVVSTLAAVALGVYAGFMRLAWLDHQLLETPVRKLAGQLALSRAQAASVLWLAQIVGAALLVAWPATAPSTGRRPLHAVLVGIIGIGVVVRTPLGVVTAAGAAVILWMARREARGAHGAAALLLLSALALAAEVRLHHLLLLADRADAAHWPWAWGARWLSIGAALVGLAIIVRAMASARWAAALALAPLLVVPEGLSTGRWAPPLAVDGPLARSPGDATDRVVGGCVHDLDPPDAAPLALPARLPLEGLLGCDAPPQGPYEQVWLARPDTPAQRLTQPVGRAGVRVLATRLAPAFGPLEGWSVGRWALPQLRAAGTQGPGTPTVAHTAWLQLRPQARWVLPEGEVHRQFDDEAVTELLGGHARVDLAIDPSGLTVAELLGACDRALRAVPVGLRCGVAVGEAADWVGTEPVP